MTIDLPPGVILARVARITGDIRPGATQCWTAENREETESHPDPEPGLPEIPQDDPAEIPPDEGDKGSP